MLDQSKSELKELQDSLIQSKTEMDVSLEHAFRNTVPLTTLNIEQDNSAIHPSPFNRSCSQSDHHSHLSSNQSMEAELSLNRSKCRVLSTNVSSHRPLRTELSSTKSLSSKITSPSPLSIRTSSEICGPNTNRPMFPHELLYAAAVNSGKQSHAVRIHNSGKDQCSSNDSHVPSSNGRLTAEQLCHQMVICQLYVLHVYK